MILVYNQIYVCFILFQTLEAAMPLLASKLTPSTISKLAASSSMPSHLKHQQQQQQQIANDSAVFLSSPVASASPSLPMSSSTSSTRKPSQIVTPAKQSAEAHQQQQNVRHPQQPHGLNFLSSKQLHSESGALSDHSWNHQQTQRQTDTHPQTIGNQGELHASSIDKQQTLERLFLQANVSGNSAERNIQTDMSMKVETHAQTIPKHQSSQHGYQRSGTASAQMSSVQAMLASIGQNYSNKGTFSVSGRNVQTLGDAHPSKTHSKFKPGESKQTAIDVDMDIGQLASITGDGANVHTDPSACNSTHIAAQDLKQSGLYSFVDQHLCSTPVCEISSSLAEHTNTKSRDHQPFIPVHTVKSSSSSVTHHSLTSSLAHIPKPIVHASSSSLSSSSSSSISVAATRLPPPPDYIPPPPYPSKLNQSLPQQQQHPSKSGQGIKHSVQNPFTFPTTGVRLHTDPNSLDQSYSYVSQLGHTVGGLNDIKQELCEHFQEPKEELKYLSKSHSDISDVYTRHRDTAYTSHNDMPRLCPEVTSVKEEITGDQTNHMDNMNDAGTRPVVCCLIVTCFMVSSFFTCCSL